VSAALELRGVTAGYGETDVLRDIDLVADEGAVTALLGPNGAGKSTLLKTVSGLIRPKQGTVLVGGTDVTSLSPNKRVVDHGMCHIPEGRGIFRSLTVRENLQLQAFPKQGDEALERVTTAFPILGVRLDQRCGTLSGGQQQMLAMARAYVQRPKLVLVDEASLGLAPIVVDEIFEFLTNITREGASLLIVDQFVARALAMATSAYILNRGTIVYSGSPKELLDGDVFEQYLGTQPEASSS
jgi:branched-chain amino acid transport system ATP-binding protein